MVYTNYSVNKMNTNENIISYLFWRISNKTLTIQESGTEHWIVNDKIQLKNAQESGTEHWIMNDKIQLRNAQESGTEHWIMNDKIQLRNARKSLILDMCSCSYWTSNDSVIHAAHVLSNDLLSFCLTNLSIVQITQHLMTECYVIYWYFIQGRRQ